MRKEFVLALDQGTTSSRSIVFDVSGAIRGVDQVEFEQHFPKPGWVEHDAEEIWNTQISTARNAISKAGISASDLGSIGITNQRETVVLWDRKTGTPLHNALVWQDRRTSDLTAALKAEGHESDVQSKTGLLLDPYFAGSKLKWLLDNLPSARERAAKGELAAGTIDCWLLWKLTEGAVHATDVSNASRTLLWNIHTCDWDEELLALLDIPREVLPKVVPSSGELGMSPAKVLGADVPVCGIAGDQQAALFGQQCVKSGMVKNTYGTGCFMLMNTGAKPKASASRLLTTVAWQIGDSPVQYALEGSVFIAGAAIQWLRDGLKIIKAAPEVNDLAGSVSDTGDVYLVPAFVGLGAPYWDPTARGAILGITRGTTDAHIALATLRSLAYSTYDILQCMRADSGVAIEELRVDGGASASDLLLQFQADVVDVAVQRPEIVETTALGAAYLAGLASGVWNDLADVESHRKIDRVFTPDMDDSMRKRLVKGWTKAVERTREWAVEDDA